MLTLGLSALGPLRSVLAIGCHADDIEIGCGGLMLGLAQTFSRIDVNWIVFSAPARRAAGRRTRLSWARCCARVKEKRPRTAP